VEERTRLLFASVLKGDAEYCFSDVDCFIVAFCECGKYISGGFLHAFAIPGVGEDKCFEHLLH
jgi:hypothetical protein